MAGVLMTGLEESLHELPVRQSTAMKFVVDGGPWVWPADPAGEALQVAQ
jgi:hypothetical protein